MSPSDRPKPPSGAPPPDSPDFDAPPSREELDAAEALRRLLDGESGSATERGRGPGQRVIPGDGDAEARAAGEFVRSVRAAASPATLSPERHGHLLDRALSAAGTSQAAHRGAVAPRRQKTKVAYLVFGGAASVLALAAAVALMIRSTAPGGAMASKVTAARGNAVVALSRSTAELFPEGIPRSGGTTARVDRIAYARAQDFRQNQFARWGTQ